MCPHIASTSHASRRISWFFLFIKCLDTPQASKREREIITLPSFLSPPTPFPSPPSFSHFSLFVPLSGVGALIAKKSALRMLKRPMFTGGTVSIASVKVCVRVCERERGREGERVFDFMWRKNEIPHLLGLNSVAFQGSVSNMHENHEGFEDGTPNFLSIGQIKTGLQFLEVSLALSSPISLSSLSLSPSSFTFKLLLSS